MPTTEERVATLEEIARNHAALLQRQQQSIELLTTLAEGSARMEQRIIQGLEDLATRFGRVEEETRVLRTEVGALRTEMGAFRT